MLLPHIKRNTLLLSLLSFLLLSFSGFTLKHEGLEDEPEICLSAEEQRLYELIMKYRKVKKLPSIPVSSALTKVAQAHVRDLSLNKPNNTNECNMHSWSDKGNWTPCCYDRKHSQAQCMWSKPKEIAGFQTDGYEIVYGSVVENFVATPDAALATWKKSPSHHAVIVNADIWKNRTWKSIGIGVYNNYICVWFASDEDKQGAPAMCK